MKVSFQWLKDYVEVSFSPAELANLLTHSGLEVENLSQSRPAFEGVVVGELVSFRAHPQADHLSVCTVRDGQREYSIVCGAPKLQAGKRVALALEGASLPGGVRIVKTSIRGFPSEGMLCSEKELGLGEDAYGIMFLDSGPPMGTPLETALGLGDWIFDLNVTPNRPDCLCILGIAREVAALTGETLHFPSERKPERTELAERHTSVTIECPDLCPRYVAKLIFGVKIAPSPLWVRLRLEAVGIRSINNIVDVTNYVMMEMGQPLHAFDFDLLEGKRIMVRTAYPGERFTTLDGVERLMPEGALMICDGKGPVALAGIMGGLNSEVRQETGNILLESAYFEPMGIRRTSKQVGLTTEASLRFERGIDPNGSLRAAERAALLMAELGDGSLAREVVDNYPRPIEPRKILLRVPRVNKILGTDLGGHEIRAFLQHLQLQVEPEGLEAFRVMPPTFRVDLEREIDLIEEVARLHGFHRIPVTLPSGRVCAEKRTKMQRAEEQARILLLAAGFREVIHYSFISPKDLAALNLLPSRDRRARALRIHNPLSEDQSFMRTTLIPGLLNIARMNLHRQNINLKLFELGRVFFPREGQDLPEEVKTLSGLLSGLRDEESWAKPKEECDFFDLKGSVETLLDGLGVAGYHFFSEEEEPFLHPGKSCRVEGNGEVLGVLGEVHPDVQEAFGLKQRIFLFELNLEKMVETTMERHSFRPLARYPAVTRDLALIVGEDTSAGELLDALWEANNGWIAEIKLFDLYRGNPIPTGRKSVAFRLKFQREDRTLTEEEVNEFYKEIVGLLAKRFGATLR